MRIAVVGGGPAGATCARLLAAGGAAVSLFEARPAAEKPCGGGVPSHALGEFPELTDPALGRRVVRRVVVHSPSGRTVAVPLDGGVHIFKRCEMDSLLRRRAVAAGASLAVAKVLSVRRLDGGRWEARTDQGPAGPFDGLVGADGVRGVVRRTLVGRHEDGHLTLGVYAYVPGVPIDDLILKFFGDFDGYAWIFPRTDHVSVGICAGHRRVGAAQLETRLRLFVERHYPEAAFPPESVRGYFIPADPDPARVPGDGAPGPGGGGWALVGDAGGFVDPVTREGIAHAMRSAVAVARGLGERGYLRTPTLPGDLAWAHRHAAGFYRRQFLEWMARTASASPAIRGVLADLFTGRQPYGTLKRRLLLNAVPCGLQAGLRFLRAPARAPAGKVRD